MNLDIWQWNMGTQTYWAIGKNANACIHHGVNNEELSVLHGIISFIEVLIKVNILIKMLLIDRTDHWHKTLFIVSIQMFWYLHKWQKQEVQLQTIQQRMFSLNPTVCLHAHTHTRTHTHTNTHTNESYLFPSSLFSPFLFGIHHCLWQWTAQLIYIKIHYRLRKRSRECVIYIYIQIYIYTYIYV